MFEWKKFVKRLARHMSVIACVQRLKRFQILILLCKYVQNKSMAAIALNTYLKNQIYVINVVVQDAWFQFAPVLLHQGSAVNSLNVSCLVSGLSHSLKLASVPSEIVFKLLSLIVQCMSNSVSLNHRSLLSRTPLLWKSLPRHGDEDFACPAFVIWEEGRTLK